MDFLALTLSLTISRPACSILFMRLSSAPATRHASWLVIKQCGMIQSQIYLRCAAGSCHLACFRNQISLQRPLPSPPFPTKSLRLAKCFPKCTQRATAFPITNFLLISSCERQTAAKWDSKASFALLTTVM